MNPCKLGVKSAREPIPRPKPLSLPLRGFLYTYHYTRYLGFVNTIASISVDIVGLT